MAFYNNKGEKFEFNITGKYYGGNVADIYKLDNIMLKFLPWEVTTPEEVIKVLKNIKHPNFINILEYFFITENSKNVYAYTYEYIHKNEINVLENIEFFLDNINRLEIVFDMLSYENVLAQDIKRDNVIINENDIVLIDPDFYYINENEDAYHFNKEKLLLLIRVLVEHDLKKYPLIDKEKFYEDYFVMNKNYTIEDNFAYQLSKTIKPINKYLK